MIVKLNKAAKNLPSTLSDAKRVTKDLFFWLAQKSLSRRSLIGVELSQTSSFFVPFVL